MKIFVFSDTQFTKSKWHNQKETWIKIIKLIRKKKVDAVVCNGDFFDTPHIPVIIYKDIVAGIKNSNVGVNNWYFVNGNHDKIGIGSSSLDPFSLGAKVYYDTTFVPEINCVLCPYKKDVTKLIKEINDQVANVPFIGHIPLSSYERNNVGVEYAHLKKFTISLLGHYHVPKKISKKTQIMGSPYVISHDDAQGREDSRGVYILDTDTMELEFVDIPCKKYITVTSVDRIKDDGNIYRIIANEGDIPDISGMPNVTLKIKRNFISIHDIGVHDPHDTESLLKEWMKLQNINDKKLLKTGMELVNGTH